MAEKEKTQEEKETKSLNLKRPEKWLSTTLLLLAIAYFAKQTYYSMKRTIELILELYHRIKWHIKRDVKDLRDSFEKEV